MLARIQQILCGIGLLSVLAWWAWQWAQAAPFVDYLIFPLAMLVLYALVLATEFALMHLRNRDDPAPRAGMLHLLSSLWHEMTTAPLVFCWRQPVRSALEPDLLHGCANRQRAGRSTDGPEPAQARGVGARGVLLIHGFVCNRGLWLPWLRELRHRDVPCIALNLEPVFGGIEEYEPLIDAAVDRLRQATGQAPIVVAHSMGGLAARFWWCQPGRSQRLHKLITLGTPHHGTWLARFAMSTNGRQMRPDSDWLKQLNGNCGPDQANRMICFYSHCDNIVFPASSAKVAGADNRHLTATAHVHMVGHPAPREVLWQCLRTDLQGA